VTLRDDGPALAAALLVAAGAKAGYSVAGPDELRFMTAPTQALVGALRGIDFTWEAGYGYVSLADRLVIAKSCTGVNYLLAVFGLLVFTLVPAAGGRRGKLAAVAPIAIGALGVTVIVNAVRISLGVALHDGGLAWGWMTAERVHRLAGIVVYFASLVAVHAAGRCLVNATGSGARATESLVAAPLVAYGVVAIVVPLANGALAARPILFAEHVAWIVLVAFAPALFFVGIRRRSVHFPSGTR
jgi:exosortase K